MRLIQLVVLKWSLLDFLKRTEPVRPLEILSKPELSMLHFGITEIKTIQCTLMQSKSNIGHLENANGIAGVIKTIMALKKALYHPILGLK